jgi:hypothetical protein
VTDEFRINFFFGPDEKPDSTGVLVCVFNVKKRSWKGGVQVGVELFMEQLQQLADGCQLDELIEMIRAKVEPAEFSDYQQRARDLFIQRVCMVKLNLVVGKGIHQENQTIPADAMKQELDSEIPGQADSIRQAILTELDV